MSRRDSTEHESEICEVKGYEAISDRDGNKMIDSSGFWKITIIDEGQTPSGSYEHEQL